MQGLPPTCRCPPGSHPPTQLQDDLVLSVSTCCCGQEASVPAALGPFCCLALSWALRLVLPQALGPPHARPLPASSRGIRWFSQRGVLKRIQLVLISTNLVNFN